MVFIGIHGGSKANIKTKGEEVKEKRKEGELKGMIET